MTRTSRARRGSLFVEGAIALAVIASVFALLAWRQTQTARDARDAAAASTLRTMQTVVQTVVARNYAAIRDTLVVCTGGSTCPNGALVAFDPQNDVIPGLGTTLAGSGLFAPGFTFRDAHGGRYALWLRRSGSDQLDGLVLTNGGTVLDDARAGEIATRADAADGGAILRETPTRVSGGYGTWSLDLAPFAAAGFTLPGAGHVAMLLRFDPSRIVADYVHRLPTGQDEAATMHVDLVMGQGANAFAIRNAETVGVRQSIALRPDSGVAADQPCDGRAGRIASASDGNPLACVVQSGVSTWRRVALLPSCNVGQSSPSMRPANSSARIRRGRPGSATTDAILALAVVSMLAVGALVLFDRGSARVREQRFAQQISDLAQSVRGLYENSGAPPYGPAQSVDISARLFGLGFGGSEMRGNNELRTAYGAVLTSATEGAWFTMTTDVPPEACTLTWTKLAGLAGLRVTGGAQTLDLTALDASANTAVLAACQGAATLTVTYRFQ